jgi:CRP/FNR family cyclic AMP-dependent transcriptional regulator
MRGATVSVLDHDPELGDGIARERLSAAARDARATTLVLARGLWEQPVWPGSVRAGLGLLVLDGLLVRRVNIDGRFSGELLGRGDVLRPWQEDDAFASVSCSSGWRVLEPARVALMDLDFVRRVAPYPEINGQLLARALRRARQLAINIAIIHQPKVETRLHMLLWHLADRWGIVRAGGVYLPTRLTHAVLSELVAAQRPTVSVALGTLQRSGLVTPNDEGWTLHGEPPGESHEVSARAPALVACV